MTKEHLPETDPQEALTGWQKLHQDYLQRKEREAQEKKKKDEEHRRRILRAVPDKKEEKTDELGSKKKKKKVKKPKQEKQKSTRPARPPLSRGQLLRSFPVFLVAGFGLLMAVYFMSPLATAKQIRISGNQKTDKQQILEHTGIDDRDYTLTTFLSQKAYEKNIVASSPWIRSARMVYQFPTTFNIQVSEYGIIAYQLKDQQYYPILTDGTIIDQAAQNPETDQVVVEFDDPHKIKELAKALDALPSSERKQIQTISLTPSTASSDLLTLEMKDGNQVLVPLSEFDKKMAYYPSVASQITEASIIDMESGIFSYTKASAQAQEAAKKEQENQEQETNEPKEATDLSQTEETLASSEPAT